MASLKTIRIVVKNQSDLSTTLGLAFRGLVGFSPPNVRRWLGPCQIVPTLLGGPVPAPDCANGKVENPTLACARRSLLDKDWYRNGAIACQLSNPWPTLARIFGQWIVIFHDIKVAFRQTHRGRRPWILCAQDD